MELPASPYTYSRPRNLEDAEDLGVTLTATPEQTARAVRVVAGHPAITSPGELTDMLAILGLDAAQAGLAPPDEQLQSADDGQESRVHR